MLPILQVGPLAIQLPGLLLLVGVWIATYLIDKEAPRHKLSAATLNNMVLFSLIAGILGARLGYALRFLNVYLERPLDLLSLNPSTLSAVEGLAAAGIVALIYGNRHGLKLWVTLDALTPALALFTICIGLAHLASGDAFGAATSVPWSIDLWGERRHPTQIYEILLAGAAFLVVVRLSSRLPLSGFTFFLWLALAAASRLLLEAFRGDSIIAFDRFRLAQLISLGVLLVAMLGMHLLAARGHAKAASGGKG